MQYFALLSLCLILGGVGSVVRRKRPFAGHALIALACLGVTTALAWQVYQFTARGTPRPVDRYHAAVAYHLGYEVLSELRGLRGTIGLVLPPDTRSNQRALDTAFDTLARVLSPLPGLELEELALEAKPNQIANGTVPLDAFERALNQAPQALAYVSLAGLPQNAARLSLWTRPNPPPLFVFDPSGATNWLAPLKAGRLKRVVVRRPELKHDEGRQPAAGPPDEIFQRFFQWATPANADTIAAQLEAAASRR